MNELEKIQGEVAFWKEIGPALEEFEAARETKKEDPERWEAAKQALDGEEKNGEGKDGIRTLYRKIAEFLTGPGEDDNVNVGVETIDAEFETISPVKEN